METNFTYRNPNLLNKDSAEAKTVKAADKKDFSDAVIDGTNKNQEELLKDIEGAIHTEENVFIKTDKGIIKIDKDKVPEALADLREKLSKNEEYKVTGIGLDLSKNEFKVSFAAAPEAKRWECIDAANTKRVESGSKAMKEYNKDVSSALKIENPDQRKAALEKAENKFDTAIKKGNDLFIKDIKAANTTFVNDAQRHDPEHLPQIKKDIAEYMDSTIKAVKQNFQELKAAIHTHSECTIAAANISDPETRLKALAKANSDYNDHTIDKIQENYGSAIEKADTKVGIRITFDKGGIIAANKKSDSRRAEDIDEADTKRNEAGNKANREYNQEILSAIKITDPVKRLAALQTASTKYETAIKKGNDEFIADIAKANSTFLERIQAVDPENFGKIKQDIDNNQNEVTKAINQNTTDLTQNIETYAGKVKEGCLIKNPKDRETALDKAKDNYNNNLTDIIQQTYYHATGKADNKLEVMLANDRGGLAEAGKKADTQRYDANYDADTKKNEAGRKANNEFNSEIVGAIAITDPVKRAAAVQKAADKFETAIKNANQQYINDLKVINTDYLEIIKAVDPGHYDKIKQEVEHNESETINAVNQNNTELVQNIATYAGKIKEACLIKNPQERATTIDRLDADYNNNITDKIQKDFNKQISKADNKLDVMLALDRGGVSAAVKKADSQRSDAIYDADTKKNETGKKANTEYNTEVVAALKIVDPVKRAEALKQAGSKFEAAVQKANDQFINTIKSINNDYLETIKTVDPGHLPEITKASEYHINSLEKAVGKNNSDLKQNIENYLEKMIEAAGKKHKTSSEREADLNKVDEQYNKTITKTIQPEYNSAVENADSKYAADLNIILSLK
jgi:hypothetical protein